MDIPKRDFADVLVPFTKTKIVDGVSSEGDLRVAKVTFKDPTKFYLRISKVCLDYTQQTIFFRGFYYQSIYSHPAILPLMYLSTSPENRQFEAFYPYPENGKLSNYIGYPYEHIIDNKPTLTSTQKSIIAYGIAQALKFLHSKSLFFSDVSAKNVYLDKRFYPYLTNFYSVKRLHDPNSKPENRLNPLHQTLDVYAYSFIYAALVEPIELPTRVNNEEEFFRAIKRGERPICQSILPRQLEILQQMWTKNPKDRITFTQIVSHFENSGDLLFENTDINEFNHYKALISSKIGQEPADDSPMKSFVFAGDSPTHSFGYPGDDLNASDNETAQLRQKNDVGSTDFQDFVNGGDTNPHPKSSEDYDE